MQAAREEFLQTFRDRGQHNHMAGLERAIRQNCPLELVVTRLVISVVVHFFYKMLVCGEFAYFCELAHVQKRGCHFFLLANRAAAGLEIEPNRSMFEGQTFFHGAKGFIDLTVGSAV
mmetsp:Transcript_97651/g.173954  ORF Transcript_97651/g.173954 Transcript_97651/m.173954 type:complete len:117 (-) Transcript_97651:72-422(-)